MKELLKATGRSLKSWGWTKAVLYWVVMSAGTGAECAFLLASLWVTINASVHSFILLFISEQTTVHLSQLATVAYVGLPEAILSLAIVTTLSHIRMYLYDRRDSAALVWSILYGIPTLVFLALSLITIGCSLLSINFQLPPYMIVMRGLSGYGYGLIALLYTQIGLPQEKDRLQKKDELLAELRREKDAFIDALRNEKDITIATIRRDKDALLERLRHDKDAAFALLQQQSERANTVLQSEVNRLNAALRVSEERLEESLLMQARLATTINKASETASQAYSEELKNWLEREHKTISIDDIVALTGHHRRKVNNAIASNALVTASRNKTLVLTASFVSWLTDNPPPVAKEQNEVPQLRLVNG